MHKRSAHGFTLIELSIVLVIIALVVGGVLVGRELIQQAQLRKLLADKDRFVAAAHTFQGKYGALPGDMTPDKSAKFNLFTFTGIYAGSVYGNGDQNIDQGSMEHSCLYECSAFWRHLSQTQLIADQFTVELNTETNGNECPGGPTGQDTTLNCTDFTHADYMPKSPVNGGFWGASHTRNVIELIPNQPAFTTFNNTFYLHKKGDAAVNYMNRPTMSALDMVSLDLKSDDGKPNTGKILALTLDGGVFDYINWSATVDATSTVCTTGGSSARDLDVVYNANEQTGGNSLSCIPIFGW